MAGIATWAAYVPYWRLRRQTIGDALGIAPGAGARAVASYDEDATSMAVEAGRAALAVGGPPIDSVTFTTAAPPYLDKTNATAVHAALALPVEAAAFDLVGSPRSAVAALLRGLDRAEAGGRPLVTFADVRTGLPGGADERDGGDAGAAFVFAPEGVTETLGVAHATEEFLDRWRTPGALGGGQWEERFGEQAYVPLGEHAAMAALSSAELGADAIDHVIVSGTNQRAVRAVIARLGARSDAIVPDLTPAIGHTGAAHVAVALCDVLDRAGPAQTVLVVSLADGADAVVLRTTGALPAAQAARADFGVPTVAAAIAGGDDRLAYATFATWRGTLVRESPRRPDPEVPAAPPSSRRERWKFAFTGTRCDACGTRHLPPARACVQCRAIDRMVDERVADVAGTVATFTVDHLAFTPSPPMVAAVIDFDGGGRFTCELTDLDPGEVHIGLRVTMTFRRLHTANGVHNYFWKARPLRPVAAPVGGSP